MRMSGTSWVLDRPRGTLARGGRLSPKPAGPDSGLPVPGGVRLDVEDGRPVDDVDPRDLEPASVPPEELEDAQAQGIRAVRRARGEDAPRPGFARGDGPELGLPGPMEMKEDDDMREPLDVVEGLGELREDLDLAEGPLEEARRGERGGRQIGGLFEERADDADGPEADAGTYFPT